MIDSAFLVEYQLLDGTDELAPAEAHLMALAQVAANNAYAPYSNFRVGAAIMLDDGTICCGNNQENAAYPSGLCAERVALFYAFAQKPEAKVKAIAITAISAESLLDRPVTPCGACRQVMAEYEKKAGTPMRIIMQGQRGKVLVVKSAISLLPFAFLDEVLFNRKV